VIDHINIKRWASASVPPPPLPPPWIASGSHIPLTWVFLSILYYSWSRPSAGGGTLGPQSLLLYEPEEALVPLWAKDLSPKVYR
jgi:hypothetical protein